MTQVYRIIEQKLTDTYTPHDLQITDESHLHQGHSGARPEGGTHFRVYMVAALFDGMSRVARQRHVLDCLADELQGPVHALALKLRSPQEADEA
jgi:BolA protein